MAVNVSKTPVPVVHSYSITGLSQTEAKDLLQFVKNKAPKTSRMPRRTALCRTLRSALSAALA
jgi:hypothetical protein